MSGGRSGAGGVWRYLTMATYGDRKLTVLQTGILELIALGYIDPEIAERSDLTLDQAKRQVREILHHLAAVNRQNAVHVGYQAGILKVRAGM